MAKIYFKKISKNYKLGIIAEEFSYRCKNLKLKGNPYKTGIRTWKDSNNDIHIAFVYKTKRIVFWFPTCNNKGEL